MADSASTVTRFWGYPLLCCLPLQQLIHFLSLTIWWPSFFHLCLKVIQDVDDGTLEGQYQSFASLMEQRLGELFVLAGQQGTRFRRAAAVGSYTVQVREPSPRPSGSSTSGSLSLRGAKRERTKTKKAFRILA